MFGLVSFKDLMSRSPWVKRSITLPLLAAWIARNFRAETQPIEARAKKNPRAQGLWPGRFGDGPEQSLTKKAHDKNTH